MKHYLCVFTGTPDAMAAWQTLSEDERKRREGAGMAAWKHWAETHARDIVQTGGPLSKTKRVSKDGISDIRNNLAAFVVVQAESQEGAARMFIDHPHFTLFPGDGVEVMEVLPVPGM
ncbi:MAG TPA: hypothetical protein VFF16_17820 [Telluria sp.]|nr:hypothetical protein [Telluria sp.]